MNILLNIIWFIFGGFLIAIEYLCSSITMMATIIGIPFGFQTLKLCAVAAWPFGTEIKSTSAPSGILNIIMNIIWWILGGMVIVITHLILGVIFFLTIIGIPFAWQHFKLARLALFPFGKYIEM